MINPEDQGGRIETHGGGMGEVSDVMIQRRAREIAIQEGRETVREDDLTRARHELVGLSDTEVPDDSAGETVTGPIPPDEPPGSPGFMTERVSSLEEENPAERLIQEGLDEAEHERMTAAEREQRRRASE